MRNLMLVLSVLCLASCGGGNETTENEDDDLLDDTSGGEEVEPGDTVNASARELIGINPPAAPWDEMSHQDREFDMIGRFHPIFREVFSERDANRWSEFSCENCHGADMRETHFEMPNASLPPVAPAGSPGYEALEGALPDMVEFMQHQVTEPMGIMLGEQEAFTCNGCHPVPE